MDYLLAAGVILGLNVTPLPGPPSWIVLTYLSLELDAHPVGIVLAGAAGAAAGRTVLVTWVRALGPRMLSASGRANVEYLAEHLHSRRTLAGVAALLAASPPPSGALYTAAGVLRIAIPLVAGACFAGRLVTYGLGVGFAGAAADELADRIRGSLGPWSIALGLAAVVAVLWVFVRIDWRTLIERRRLRLRPGR